MSTSEKDSLDVFYPYMGPVSFQAGENIICYGETAADGMYLILEGKVLVYDKDGKLINRMGAGTVFGELALLNQDVRRATVYAVTAVRCLRLGCEEFERLSRENRKIYGELMRILYQQTTKMAVEQERMRTELELASQIQTNLLVRDFSPFRELPWIHVDARMEAARSVGGDFYDVFLVDRNRLCILIADVAGKGMPAALFMAMAKTHIKNYGMLGLPLGELAFHANNRLCEGNEAELFVTAFIAMLDLKTNRVTYIDAGHNRPYIVRGDGAFEKLSCKADLVFGLMEDQTYKEQQIELNPGDGIFLYTDGITEAEDEAGDFFTEERLKHCLNRNREIRQNPGALMDAVLREVVHFRGNAEQSDDVTMLYLFR